jgi:predicted nuclease of predicted toxin-antitoxin system
MKLLIDMNLSPRWTDILTSAGIEAAHCLNWARMMRQTRKS